MLVGRAAKLFSGWQAFPQETTFLGVLEKGKTEHEHGEESFRGMVDLVATVLLRHP